MNTWSRGFLPEQDPLTQFETDSPLALLDKVGQDLPAMLLNSDFRDYARSLTIPPWPGKQATKDDLPALQLYYMRLGFLASAFIHQVGQAACTELPENIARPLCHVCALLQRPPILSYDGYALYNWRRFDKSKPIELGNIETIQNFVHLYDEHWFILIHVDIEARAAEQLSGIFEIQASPNDKDTVDKALTKILASLNKQIEVLERIPEHMDDKVYFQSFRPYIRFFEKVTYVGVDQLPAIQRGETGAQSSILPLLTALMKIPHEPTELMNHLADMQNYMPCSHRALIARTAAVTNIKAIADADIFDRVLESLAVFREVHYGWATTYIDQHVADPRGTGGTPFMLWLKQLIDETRRYKNHC